jgi:hygromycin-B 7''-O-kinase
VNFDDQFDSPEWHSVADAIGEENGFGPDQLERAGGTDHIVFYVGDDRLLKIYRPDRNAFEREKKALEFAQGKTSLSVPEIVASGNLEGYDYLVMTAATGTELKRPDYVSLPREAQVKIATGIARGLAELHEYEHVGFPNDWPEFVAERAETFIERQIARGVNWKVIAQLPKYIEESLPLVPLDPISFLHGAVHLGIMLFDMHGRLPSIAGLFDWADSRVGCSEYDLLAVGVLILQGERELQREFFRAYGYADADLTDEMRRRMMMLTMLYETADLRRYAMRLRPDAVDLDLYELEKAIWSFV